MDELRIEHVYGGSPDPIRVKLEKNTKGYQWEISVSGPDWEHCLTKIHEANDALISKYTKGLGE